MKLIGTIENRAITVNADDAVSRVAKAAIDCDGSDNRHNDPYWQSDTTLIHNGKPIDAESVPYIVVPPLIRNGVPGVVMGCQARITHTHTRKSCLAVVADVGPRAKIGELSCEAARRIGLDGNPNHGGTDDPIVLYEIFPGQAAIVDGVTYDLQPA